MLADEIVFLKEVLRVLLQDLAVFEVTFIRKYCHLFLLYISQYAYIARISVKKAAGLTRIQF